MAGGHFPAFAAHVAAFDDQNSQEMGIAVTLIR
jgi:hypothetical protein